MFNILMDLGIDYVPTAVRSDDAIKAEYNVGLPYQLPFIVGRIFISFFFSVIGCKAFYVRWGLDLAVCASMHTACGLCLQGHNTA